MVKVTLINADVLAGLARLPDESVQKGETIKSISFDQNEILQNIMALHTGPIQADVTFGSGCFYKPPKVLTQVQVDGTGMMAPIFQIPILSRPPLCFDLEPRVPGVIAADVRRLPLRDCCLNSVMFDPPFLIKTGPGAKLKERFGCQVGNMQDLWGFYFRAMKEIHRVLIPGGWLIFKCQDGVLSGVNYFTHLVICEWGMKLGFKPIDLFILLVKHRMTDRTHKVQKHARKYHSYFWVFKKVKR